MAAGTVLINMSPRNYRIFKAIQPLTPPLYAVFFVLAGMELDPRQFLNPAILLLGSAYILFRAAGKYGGVYAGCAIMKDGTESKKVLGFLYAAPGRSGHRSYGYRVQYAFRT
jgi:Kef-type K+ transport system membrane component KefB